MPFENFAMDFVSKSIATELQSKLNACSLVDQIAALRRNDDNEFIMEAATKIYQSVIADFRTSEGGVR